MSEMGGYRPGVESGGVGSVVNRDELFYGSMYGEVASREVGAVVEGVEEIKMAKKYLLENSRTYCQRKVYSGGKLKHKVSGIPVSNGSHIYTIWETKKWGDEVIGFTLNPQEAEKYLEENFKGGQAEV